MSICTPRFGCSNANVYLYAKYNITGFVVLHVFVVPRDNGYEGNKPIRKLLILFTHSSFKCPVYLSQKSNSRPPPGGRRSKIPFKLHSDKNLCRKRPASFLPRLSEVVHRRKIGLPWLLTISFPRAFRCRRNATLH